MFKENKLKTILLIIGIIFVAFNLRPSITAVGPIIGDIRADIGISNSVAGLLTTLPLLAFAGLSLFAPKLSTRFGNEWTIFIGLILLGIGIVIRPTDAVSLLFIGTFLVGSGIAICNVILPSIVKHKFAAQVGLMTGMYTLAMSGAASIASGVSVPIAHDLNFGWQGALLFWGAITIVAIIFWIPQLKRNQSDTNKQIANPTESSVWSSKLAWQVTIFMGLQSFLFYCLVTWLPEILHTGGMSLALSGWMVSILQIVGLPSTMIAPYLAGRLVNQKPIMVVVGILYLPGFILLLIGGQLWVIVTSVVLLGVAQGATIGLSLTFLSLRARNAKQAANLSGMAQSVGYLLAAIGPFVIGFMFDLTSSWNGPIITLLIVCVVMTFFGIKASRNAYV
ncbi:CynX/NimT family MFS transporter [Alkalibacillus haloalkaliphilus]|uniref:CynX/NimT family MFS transporter n=1 Tax=Alkalibacillus haloalkaliphilus TaxID=94136 RepID=UPI00293557AC|nr:MFS transporter [Alkalibacillus haloalkaliphilus]MDV2581917.1 MFS transporter [Alkalibacillus haloalkaliphilus]